MNEDYCMANEILCECTASKIDRKREGERERERELCKRWLYPESGTKTALLTALSNYSRPVPSHDLAGSQSTPHDGRLTCDLMSETCSSTQTHTHTNVRFIEFPS